MFITVKRAGYDRDGQQVSSGRFLALMQPDTPDGLGQPLRGIVRFAALTQLGHFMMGRIRVKGHSLTVSGAYGSDGLPMTVPPEVYDAGVELPAELYDLWAKGGGWNSAGSEGPALRKWALETFGR
jgi:hypothetical protein